MEGSKTSSSTMQVSFVCQRCSQPLKLDTSFKILDRVTIQELTGQRGPWKEGDQDRSKWAALEMKVLRTIHSLPQTSLVSLGSCFISLVPYFLIENIKEFWHYVLLRAFYNKEKSLVFCSCCFRVKDYVYTKINGNCGGLAIYQVHYMHYF